MKAKSIRPVYEGKRIEDGTIITGNLIIRNTKTKKGTPTYGISPQSAGSSFRVLVKPESVKLISQ